LNIKQQFNLIPGIILAFILYSFSQALNNIIGTEILMYEKSPFSTAMLAIILGLILGNIFNIRKGFLIGLDFTQKYILKLGIIFLGIQLKPFEFIQFGTLAIPLILICIIAVLIVIKLLVRWIKISKGMSYLIAIGSTVCGTTAIIATAPVINAKKSEVSYAIANMTVFGIFAMLLYPYFANYYFQGNELLAGLFLGTAIHETSQVAAAGVIYDQQFNSPETLNIATLTKLIRNTFLVVMIPLFAFLYHRGEKVDKKYSIISIFPYFVLGFILMIVIRNVGDFIYLTENNKMTDSWSTVVNIIGYSAKIFLTMSMAAVGLSTNLKDIRKMGFKPFVVGLVSLLTVGLISIFSIELLTKIIT
tara:strand:+ start:1516 stop:2598 length:1083 start_codon:yes stop_codon:yes gene_type:complete